MKKALILLISLISVLVIHAQDTIQTKSGRIIECNIRKITSDSLFFALKMNNSSVQTFVLMNDISRFVLSKAESLAKTGESLQMMRLSFENNEELFVQYLNYDNYLIEVYECNAGKLFLRAEEIKDFALLPMQGKYQIKMQNNNIFYGEIVGLTPGEVKLKTENSGVITLSICLVEEVKPVEEQNFVGGSYWMPNPNKTRYFFAPSAMNLKKGEGYYQNAYLLANSLNYGISDYFSFGGLVVIPAFALITPKVGFPVAKNFHLGAGFMGGVIIGPAIAGLAYAAASYGNIENNITFGAGYYGLQPTGKNSEENYYAERPVLTLNGMLRAGKKVALVTENWAVPYEVADYSDNTVSKEYYLAFMYGFRIMREKLTFDIALINSKDIIDVVPIGVPYLDLVYKF